MQPEQTTKLSPMLELVAVTKYYRPNFWEKQRALNRVSMAFASGSCTGLLGHNGAGKTTAIKTMLGLIRPDQGEILFQGRPMRRVDRTYVGYMPEVNKLPRNLTLEEILNFQLILQNSGLSHHQRHQRIDRSLSQVGLLVHRRKKVRELSKGLGQRLAWAQASIHEPKLLILDEPFTGLDPVGRAELHGWVHEQKLRGTAIILCTHELWSVRSLCDDVHILRQGELAFSSVDRLAFGSESGGLFSQAPFYTLQVSGVTQSDLDELHKKNNLPSWQSSRHDGGLMMIGLAKYSDAVAWLEACHRAGHVIVRFGGDEGMEDEVLLRYLKPIEKKGA